MFNPTWLYTGAVYAGAVWLARRCGVALPKRVAAFFYALVFVFMYLPLTQDYVNVPVDFLRELPPWVYADLSAKSLNGQLNDLPLQIIPWAHQVRESWRALEPPLWNAMSGSGYPLLASAQSSALSPLRLLGLPLSLGHALTFESAMKILLALTFMFLWCRERGRSELASVIGAVAFGFSSFIITWLHFPLITTACLVPAVLYLVDRIAERPTFGRFAAGAAVWAAMLFGGHPETVSHTFFLALLYASWIAFVERSLGGRVLKFFLTLGGAMAVAGLLAAPFLVPFAEAVTKSKRYAELQSRTDVSAEVPFADYSSAILLLQPYFWTDPPFEPFGPTHAESISGFAGLLGIAGWFAALAHVIRRRKWRSREMFFLLATLFVLGVILNWPVISDAFHLVFQLAANARLRLLLALLLAMQTATAVDLIRDDRRSLFIGLGAAAALIVVVMLTAPIGTAEQRDHALAALVPSILVLLIAAIAPALRRRERTQYFVTLALLIAVISELWAVGRVWNPVLPDKWMYPPTPMLETLDELKAQATEPFRISGNTATFFPNVSAVYGYEDVRAHDPMVNSRYIRLLAHIAGYDIGNYFAPWPDWETHFLDFLNVRYVLTSPGGELPPRYRLVYDGPDGRLFENTTVLPRFYAVENVVADFERESFRRRLRELQEWNHTAVLDELELESEQQREDFFAPRPPGSPVATTRILDASTADYRIHVKAPRWSLVVSSIPWWPGWKVERNGARVDPIRVNGGFLGFAVPPGELDVRVWYDPWTFRIGAFVSIATILALIAYGRWRSASASA